MKVFASAMTNMATPNWAMQLIMRGQEAGHTLKSRMDRPLHVAKGKTANREVFVAENVGGQQI